MSLLLAGRDEQRSHLRQAAACAAVAVLLQILFAQLTLALAGCLVLIGWLSRWRPGWLLAPAAVGVALTLAVGPRTALAGYVAAADLVIRRFTGPGAWASLPASLARWRDWLPAQLPVGLVAAAAEASVAALTGLVGGIRPYRSGALVTLRRAYLVACIRRGELATADGGRIGLVRATGRAAAIEWQEAERGALCTGREREAVTATGLDLARAAIQHRKTVIIVDLAGGAASALQYEEAGESGDESLLLTALADRQVVVFSAGAAVADLAVILAERSQVGVPEDCLVWIDGCDAVQPGALRDLLAAGRRCRGVAIVVGTASGRTAAGLAAQVNVIVLAGPAPDGWRGSSVPDEPRAGGQGAGGGDERSVLVRDPCRLERCVRVR